MYLIILIFSVSGCTILEITDQKGDVKIERSFGIASIKLEGDTGLITAKVTGLGYLSTPLGYSVGYSDQMIAVTDGACRVVLWVDDKVDLKELEVQIQSVNSVCLLNGK